MTHPPTCGVVALLIQVADKGSAIDSVGDAVLAVKAALACSKQEVWCRMGYSTAAPDSCSFVLPCAVCVPLQHAYMTRHNTSQTVQYHTNR